MTTPIYRLLPAVAAWWVVSRVTCANFDEFMTCGSGSERYGRHYRYNPNLPCDLSKDGFCDSPGTQYPWSAVRRFVYENQGLMKRMYGNQRHYNVLRSELINEMYEEMFDEMPKRHHHQYQHPPPPASPLSSSPSQSPNTRTPRYHKNSNANSLKTKSWTKSSKTSGSVPSRHQKSRSMKVTAEPEYRQRTPTPIPSTSQRPKAQSSSTGNRIRIKETSATTPSMESRGSSVATDVPVNKATRTNTRRPQSSTNFPSSEPLTSSADTPPLTTENDWNSQDHLVGDDFPSIEQMAEGGDGFVENSQSTYFPPNLDDINIFDDEEFWTTLEDFDTTTPYSTLESVDSENTYSTLPQQEMVTSTPTALESDVFLEDPEDEDYFKDFISSPSDEDDVTTLTAPDESVTDINPEESDPENTDEMDMVFEESIAQEEIRQQEVAEALANDNREAMAEKGSVNNEEKELEPEMREEASAGVVHKDVLEDFQEQEPEKEAVKIKRPIRGMNACPVKEEFVAPYWANNTRGETLALLNFYPFEQYVQWERCMYEHRQMYCRKGCRCEQQYRLQKLLAFDPTNECRGIFSDWFRFPSCCVCKCYDLPQDLFTASARRPRIQPDEYDDDDEEDLYDDDEDEVDFRDFGEGDYEDDGEENDIEHRDGEEEEIPLSTLSYRVRSQGGRYVNIPPQRRPRLPPRPASHINLPHNYFAFKDKEASSSSTPPSVPTSTLGTLDVSTPHYFFNISQVAQKLPFPLSRIPRSNPEE